MTAPTLAPLRPHLASLDFHRPERNEVGLRCPWLDDEDKAAAIAQAVVDYLGYDKCVVMWRCGFRMTESFERQAELGLVLVGILETHRAMLAYGVFQ